MSRWLATEGNVEAQIKANKNKLEKCFDTVVLDNQDLTLRLSTVTPAWCRTRSIVVVQNTHSARELPLHRKWCR